MTLAILCAGQGSQNADMFSLTGAAVEAQALFAHATELLGHDPRTWVREADIDALHENRSAQLLCTLQPLCAWAALADAFSPRCCIAGYSVGEMAAWHIAGLTSASDTLALVAARADAMDAAQRARQGEQGLLFVRGLERPDIDRLCEHREAAVAIVNPGNAWVLGGMRDALADIAAQALAQGAARVVPIDVKVASHTFLMGDATAAFRNSLAAAAMARSPRLGARLFSGIDGEAVLSAAQGAQKLSLQISQTVQWASCLDACVEAGATAFFELGPGRALSDMVCGAHAGVDARSLDDFKTLQGARDWLSRMQSRF
ncbi:malonate decarboxylase subunit epsilon [Variovorax sp. H27-G14]|uniref:malonate decarboxylase subunit epsilon n=1 Tax=Variovorax sp. H27-G14 TaxID=3111914 RepID=UPI0038FC8CCD